MRSLMSPDSRTSSAFTSTGRVIRCAPSRTLWNRSGVALLPITNGIGESPTSGAPLINRWMSVRLLFSVFALRPIPRCASSTITLKCVGLVLAVFSIVCQIVHVRWSAGLVNRLETPSFCVFRK